MSSITGSSPACLDYFEKVVEAIELGNNNDPGLIAFANHLRFLHRRNLNLADRLVYQREAESSKVDYRNFCFHCARTTNLVPSIVKRRFRKKRQTCVKLKCPQCGHDRYVREHFPSSTPTESTEKKGKEIQMDPTRIQQLLGGKRSKSNELRKTGLLQFLLDTNK